MIFIDQESFQRPNFQHDFEPVVVLVSRGKVGSRITDPGSISFTRATPLNDKRSIFFIEITDQNSLLYCYFIRYFQHELSIKPSLNGLLIPSHMAGELGEDVLHAGQPEDISEPMRVVDRFV